MLTVDVVFDVVLNVGTDDHDHSTEPVLKSLFDREVEKGFAVRPHSGQLLHAAEAAARGRRP